MYSGLSTDLQFTFELASAPHSGNFHGCIRAARNAISKACSRSLLKR